MSDIWRSTKSKDGKECLQGLKFLGGLITHTVGQDKQDLVNLVFREIEEHLFNKEAQV